MNENIIWLIMGVILLSSILNGINQLRNDIKNTNRILGQISKHIGVPETSVNDDIQNQIQSLVADGKKIKAIKMYRQATGLGLKEAKEHIDLLYAKLKN